VIGTRAAACAPVHGARVCSRTTRQRGFTLTELFAVVAVAAILAAVAMPNLAEFIKNNARSARLNDLVAAFNFARGDAVTQRREAKVCATTSAGGVLLEDCDGDRFDLGYLIMTRDTPAAAWVRLRSFAPDAGGASATFTGDVEEVVFGPTGLTAVAMANVRFVYCDDRGAAAARAVALSATGHPRISQDATGNGIHDVNGVDLTCP